MVVDLVDVASQSVIIKDAGLDKSNVASAEVADKTGPVPMSFPAILRNTKITDRYAHLRDNSLLSVSVHAKSTEKRSRSEKEGKRWVRRKENARFTGNPHIIPASARDMQVDPPSVRRTFPEPLPRYLSRNVSTPSASMPIFDANSANAGRYSLSLKGMRRTLRQNSYRARELVHDIEKEIIEWLIGGTIFSPDSVEDAVAELGRPIDENNNILELSRTPLRLVWRIENDAFARYVVHCCARYHQVVSYSKDVDEKRLTYLLRPNVVLPDFGARAMLETPPATESDYSLGILSEADILSVEEDDSLSDVASDVDSKPKIMPRRLSSVSEQPGESDNGKADVLPSSPRYVEETSDADADDDVSIVGDDLVQSLESLDLDVTPREPPLRFTNLPTERTPLRDRRSFSRVTSSPSRSPCPRSRRNIRTSRARTSGRKRIQAGAKSFYEYLFA